MALQNILKVNCLLQKPNTGLLYHLVHVMRKIVSGNYCVWPWNKISILTLQPCSGKWISLEYTDVMNCLGCNTTDRYKMSGTLFNAECVDHQPNIFLLLFAKKMFMVFVFSTLHWRCFISCLNYILKQLWSFFDDAYF